MTTDGESKLVCRAVIASRSGHGTVVWLDGPDWFAEFLSDCGWDLRDVGLDDAPDGISIWEGTLRVWNCGEYGQEQDSELVGRFRDPSDDEWAMIRQNKSPWPGEL